VLGLVVSSVMGAACLIQSLGFINVLNGCLSLFVFVGLCPGAIGLYLDQGPYERTGRRMWWRLSMRLLVGACSVEALVGLFYDSNYPDELHQACMTSIDSM